MPSNSRGVSLGSAVENFNRDELSVRHHSNSKMLVDSDDDSENVDTLNYQVLSEQSGEKVSQKLIKQQNDIIKSLKKEVQILKSKFLISPLISCLLYLNYL